jgi:hypothetical protein
MNFVPQACKAHTGISMPILATLIAHQNSPFQRDVLRVELLAGAEESNSLYASCPRFLADECGVNETG